MEFLLNFEKKSFCKHFMYMPESDTEIWLVFVAWEKLQKRRVSRGDCEIACVTQSNHDS